MSRRDLYGQYAKKRSAWFIAMTWLGSFLSVGLLYLSAKAVYATLLSFRSCDANSSGLSVVSCGRNSINVLDLILVALFIGSAILVVSLFTAAWRMTRRRS